MSSALARFLSQRAKALGPSALPAGNAGEPGRFTPASAVAPRPARPEPPGDWTTTWSDGQVIAERIVLGRKVVVTYCVNKN
jgi:hypothetical protein